jgi:hypothetical protein
MRVIDFLATNKDIHGKLNLASPPNIDSIVDYARVGFLLKPKTRALIANIVATNDKANTFITAAVLGTPGKFHFVLNLQLSSLLKRLIRSLFLKLLPAVYQATTFENTLWNCAAKVEINYIEL